jgi:hypothetical protein
MRGGKLSAVAQHSSSALMVLGTIVVLRKELMLVHDLKDVENVTKAV